MRGEPRTAEIMIKASCGHRVSLDKIHPGSWIDPETKKEVTGILCGKCNGKLTVNKKRKNGLNSRTR